LTSPHRGEFSGNVQIVFVRNGRFFMPAFASLIFIVALALAMAISSPSFSQSSTSDLPVLITVTAGDGRLRDVQVIRADVDKDKWLTELPTDPGVLLASNPAVTESGRYMLVPTQGRSHGLWLASGRQAKLIDMAYLGWPSAIGASESFLWPEDPAIGDGRPQVHFLVYDPITSAREPLAASLIDDVEWVRGSAISSNRRWLLALVQRASIKGKTDAVLLDLTGGNAPRVLTSSTSKTGLVGPVSFSPDGSVVTFVSSQSKASSNASNQSSGKGSDNSNQVFYDVVAGSELARWAGAYSAAWWGDRIWALRQGPKKNTELLSADAASQPPAVVKSLRQDLGDVRFVTNAPNEVTQWPKTPAVISISVSQPVVAPGGSVTFSGVARSRDLPTHPVNGTRAGWLQKRGEEGKWKNVRYDKDGQVTIAIDSAGEFRWCSRIDFVLRDACSEPVMVVLN
jgi:hypothetical protein